MQTLPREDFPSLPDGGAGVKTALPRTAIREMVAKTQFAITGEDTRFFLNGAKFLLRPGYADPGGDRRASAGPGRSEA